jgi:hypothetical protein
LLHASDSVGDLKRLDFFDDLQGVFAVFGFDLGLVRLHQLGCGITKRDHHDGLHALLDQ